MYFGGNIKLLVPENSNSRLDCAIGSSRDISVALSICIISQNVPNCLTLGPFCSGLLKMYGDWGACSLMVEALSVNVFEGAHPCGMMSSDTKCKQ